MRVTVTLRIREWVTFLGESTRPGDNIPNIPYVRDGNYMAIVTGVTEDGAPSMTAVNVLNMAIRNLLAQGVRDVTYSPGQGVLIGRYDHQFGNPIYILPERQ